jgi:hypothetical protein
MPGHLKRSGKTGDVFETTFKIGKDGLKVASSKSTTEVLKSILSDDEDREKAAKVLQDLSRYVRSGSLKKVVNKAVTDLRSGKITDTVNTAFNANLINHTPNSQAIIDKFYSALRDKGYGAIQDLNDRKYGWKTSTPLIVFDQGTNIFKNAVATLSADSLAKNKTAADAIGTARMLAKPATTAGLAGLAITSGIRYTNAIATRKIIAEYKAEHPNSKMSDNEILKSLNK